MAYEGLCRLCLVKYDKYRNLMATKSEIYSQELIQKIEELFNLQNLDGDQLPHCLCEMCEKKLVDCYEFHKIVLQSQQKILAGMLCMVDQHHHQVIEPISSELNSSLSSDEIFNGTFDLLEDALAIANDPLNEVKEVEGDFSFIVPIVDTTTGVVPLNDDDVQRCVTNFNIDERLEYFDNSKVKVEEKIDENANQASKKENARNKFEEDSQKIKNFYDFSCPECKNTKQFENFTALKSHMKSVHKIEQPGIYCCKKKLRARHDLLTHLTFHVDPDQFKCKRCFKQCEDKEKLKRHISQNHTPISERQFHCNKCPKKFATKFNLQKHLVVHMNQHEKDELKKNHVCSICGSGFLSKSILAHHYRQMHEEKYVCVCDICAKQFKTKQNFIAHYRNQHLSYIGRRQQCNVCSRWFFDEFGLKRHIRSIHTNTGPHICIICNKITPTAEALKSHQKYSHLDERKFECQECGKAFKKHISLKEHLMTHIGFGNVGLYNCPYCSRTFNSNANMYSHKKKAHPIEYHNQKNMTILVI